MKVQEMRTKATAELQQEVVALRKEQLNLRLQSATGQLGNPAAFKRVQREIAQLKTIMTEMKKGDKV